MRYTIVLLQIILIIVLGYGFSEILLETTDSKRLIREKERSTPVNTRKISKEELSTRKNDQPTEPLNDRIQNTPKIGEGHQNPMEPKGYIIDKDGAIRVWDPIQKKHKVIK